MQKSTTHRHTPQTAVRTVYAHIMATRETVARKTGGVGSVGGVHKSGERRGTRLACGVWRIGQIKRLAEVVPIHIGAQVIGFDGIARLPGDAKAQALGHLLFQRAGIAQVANRGAAPVCKRFTVCNGQAVDVGE